MKKCKVCEIEQEKKPRIIGGRYVYLSQNDKQWRGKTCPECLKAAARKPVVDKSCVQCGEFFKTRRAKQLVCAPACREVRRSDQTKAAQRAKKPSRIG